jgi:hypothetical protein
MIDAIAAPNSVKATLNKSILDVFSGRQFGACPNWLTPNQSLA